MNAVAYENLVMCPNSFVLMVQSLELQNSASKETIAFSRVVYVRGVCGGVCGCDLLSLDLISLGRHNEC